MKKQLVLGLVLVLLIAIAAGTYFFIGQYQDKQQEESLKEAAALQLCSFDSSDVTKMDLHTPDQDYTVEIDADTGEWTVTSGEDLYLNTYYLSVLCSYGSSLTASEDLGTVDSATLESYELSDPITITYYTEGETITIAIGKQTATSEYFYMMKEGSDHVYLVDADTAGYLYVTETQLRYRYIVQDSTSDFCQLSLQRGDEVIYNFEKNDNTWEMTVPYQIPISLDTSKLSTLMITIQELEIDDFGESGITEDDYATYGFDSPAYTFSFEQDDGSQVTLLFEEYDPLVSSYINCLDVNTGEILIFDSSYLSFLQAETDDYLVSTLYKPGIESVTSMTIQYSGSFNDTTLDFETEFEIDYENAIYSCDGTDFSDSEDAVTAFQSFFQKAANLAYEQIRNETEDPGYVEDDVALRLTYTLTDDTTHTVELIPYEENNYWAYIDGVFSHVLVRQKTLSNNGMLLECYTTLMEELASAET